MRARVTLGRNRTNDVVLDHSSVSATHAEMRNDGDRIDLIDRGSRNGVFLHGRRVHHVAVAVGDKIALGAEEIEILELAELDVTISLEPRFGELWGESPEMREVFRGLDTMARSSLDLVLTGETGTGKDLAARAIHERSARRNGAFVIVDGSRLDPASNGAELVGHALGPSGIDRERRGAFGDADEGTMFLDEITELTPRLQLLLLRVLTDGEYTRVGETSTRRLNVRIVAATACDVRQAIAAGTFREDLFLRLAQGELELPPLRARGRDAEGLAQRFAHELARPSPLRLRTATLKKIRAHRWPGNVRELRNAIRGAVELAQSAGASAIEPDHLVIRSRNPTTVDHLARLASYEEVHQRIDQSLLPRWLDDHEHDIPRTAAAIGITPERLRARLLALGLQPTAGQTETVPDDEA